LIRGASNGQVSLKFPLSALALLVSFGVLFVQVTTSFAQVENGSGGKILLAGGFAGSNSVGSFLSTVELYDAVTNSFAPFLNPLAEMNTPRASAIAFAITSAPNAGKALIAGCQASNGVSLCRSRILDPDREVRLASSS